MTAPIRVLSFGAGVQSSYVARMSIIGDLPPFDHVIFADTGDEPDSVYENVAWWSRRFREAGVEFHTVGRASSIAADLRLVVRGEITSASNPPLFTRQTVEKRSWSAYESVPASDDDDESLYEEEWVPAPGATEIITEVEEFGMIRRKCTSDHKVAPIQAKLKQILGFAGKRHNHITDTIAVQTFGISWDETQRMRDPMYTWLAHDYPLVDRRITRADCIREMAEQDEFPEPVRSACWHCPFHSDDEWRYLRDNEPEAFAKAVALDADIRTGKSLTGAGLRGTPYLHRSRRPLSEVDFDNEEDRGQLNLFEQECEGMCGL